MKTITLLVGVSCFAAGIALGTFPMWCRHKWWHKAIHELAFKWGYFPSNLSQRSSHP